jgi:hypothetical protein
MITRSAARTPGMVAVVLLLARLGFAETWYEAYEAAQKAMAAQRWAAAEDKLKIAIRGGPKPGLKVRLYGVRFITYVPDYDLAVVYFNQGRFSEARDRLRAVQAQNLVPTESNERARFVRLLESSESRVAAASTLPSPAKTLGESARREEEENQARARSEDEKRRAGQERAATLERELARATSSIGAKLFEDARQAVNAAAAAGADASKTSALLRSIQVGEALEQARSAVGARQWPAAEVALKTIETLEPANAEARALRALVEKGMATLSGTSLERAAIRAFYAGEYAQASALLRKVIAADSSSARAHLYLACTDAAVALTRGPQGTLQLRDARAEFARARALDTRLKIDRQFISPRVLSTLESPGQRSTGRPR